MFTKYIGRIIRWRFLVILFTLMTTGFMVSQMRHLQVIIDPNQMLPQKHPYVIGTNLAEKVFGSNYVLVVAVAPKHGDIYQPAVLDRVRTISEGLRGLPNVKPETLMSLSAKRAKGIAGNEEGLEVKPMLHGGSIDADAIAKLKTAIQRNPIYSGVVVSDARDMATVSIAVEKGPKGFTPTLEAAYKLAEPLATDDISIAVSGTPMFVYYVEKYTQRMGLLFPIALLLVGLLHFEAFRTWQGFFLPLVTAFLSVLWGLGMMGIAKVPLDAFNASTPILILAVTAGHAVQLLKRYYEEFELAIGHGMAPKTANREAVIRAMAKVGPVMLAAGFVAVIGFLSLMSFEVATIRNFGIFTGLGILSGLIIELTFIPAVRSWLKPPKVRTQKQRFDVLTPVINLIKRAISPRQFGKVSVAFLLIVIVAAFGLTHVKVENSNKSFFASNLPFQLDDKLINEKMAGTNTLYVVFEGNAHDVIKDPKVLRQIEETQRFLETQPGIGKTISVVDLIKRMNQAMHADSPAAMTIPASRDLVSQYLLLYSMSGEPADFDRYVDYNYQYANITAFVKHDNSGQIQKVIANTKAFLAKHEDPRIKIYFGGSVPQSTALSESLVNGKLQNVLQIGLVIFAVSALLFRSLLAALLVVTPLAITALVNFGVMGLTGIPLNTPNAITAPMAIGIGADYAIYLLYRIREELGHHATLEAAIDSAMESAGRAILYVGTAIGGGYSVLMLSKGFNIHIWSGILIVMSMFVSVATTLLLLPALIQLLKPSFLLKRIGKTQATAAAGPRTALGAAGSTSGVIVLAAAVGLGALAFPQHAKAVSADVVMEKNYVANRFTDSTSKATFQMINKNGDRRVRETFGATQMQDNTVDTKRMTRFMSPADIKNTVILLAEHSDRDDDMWIYMPALKKTRRLTSANKNESFAGTDMSYGDVIGHKVSEWTHKFIGNATIANKPVLMIESLPKDAKIAEQAGYSKRISWIDEESFLALKTEFYDDGKQLLKVATLSNIVNVDVAKRRWQPMHMEVQNAQTGHKTVIDWYDFKANQGVKGLYFTPRYLETEL
ncbi:outer membrane lipoprotein-sorting protein [Jeongeupia wiesaeckerbachi]|uniref:outer membrane lipoprotein-sorting protein n=1 Tax=Jeongeupia wiesaeckerbachi TaxID=3051218 RepID=UPI003D80597C